MVYHLCVCVCVCVCVCPILMTVDQIDGCMWILLRIQWSHCLSLFCLPFRVVRNTEMAYVASVYIRGRMNIIQTNFSGLKLFMVIYL